MGPAFLTSDTTFPSDGPSKDIADGLEWAQHISQRILRWHQMGPVLPVDQLTDDLEWAQYNWQVTLPMALNGPNFPQNGYYRWSPMGPVFLTRDITLASDGPSVASGTFGQ
jgi:hypothetical protein